MLAWYAQTRVPRAPRVGAAGATNVWASMRPTQVVLEDKNHGDTAFRHANLAVPRRAVDVLPPAGPAAAHAARRRGHDALAARGGGAHPRSCVGGGAGGAAGAGAAGTARSGDVRAAGAGVRRGSGLLRDG